MNLNSVKTQFDIIAKKYDEGRRCLIPCFDDFYTRSLEILKELMPTVDKIADLGAGTGLLSMELFRLYPEAKFVLIDISDEMMEVAKQRFSGINNFSFVINDYIDHLPNDCDIIASALSIHHLEYNEKLTLYKKIFDNLQKGKCFINLDQFCGDSPCLVDAYDRWWYNYINGSGITENAKLRWLERKTLDREISVQETVKILKDVGFEVVECIYRFMKFSSVLAIK